MQSGQTLERLDGSPLIVNLDRARRTQPTVIPLRRQSGKREQDEKHAMGATERELSALHHRSGQASQKKRLNEHRELEETKRAALPEQQDAHGAMNDKQHRSGLT